MQLEVDAMQAEAASARAAAESSQAAVLEVERLGQDNSLLAARLSQMDSDFQVGLPPLQDTTLIQLLLKFVQKVSMTSSTTELMSDSNFGAFL